MVKVLFYDHSFGTSVTLPMCTVIGELCEDLSDGICVVIRVWRTEEEGEVFDPHDDNQEYANIFREAIIEMSHLVEISEILPMNAGSA